jgi:hypothetical protein
MSKNECEAIAIPGIPLCLPSCALPENGIWLGLATDLQRTYNLQRTYPCALTSQLIIPLNFPRNFNYFNKKYANAYR